MNLGIILQTAPHSWTSVTTCKKIAAVYEKAKRLRSLRLPSLKSRMVHGDLIQAYKIINHIDDFDCSTCFTMSNFDKTRNSLDFFFFVLSTTALTLENIHIVTELHPIGIHLLIM